MATEAGKIIFYNNRRCPWAHRVHIALKELNLPFEEVTIDLDKPRTPEYLEINPAGLVPALNHNGEILVESGVISQYLVDAYPSHLLPVSNAPGGALRRARITLFVEAFQSKFNGPLQSSLFTANTDEEKEAVVEKAVEGLVKHVEPLLADASPFFGGSDKLTLAEVLTASFVIRLKTVSDAELYPKSLGSKIAERAPNFTKWAEAVRAHPSVTANYDDDVIINGVKKRIAKLRAAA
ncbi:hypothetical protein VTK26DRAFT_3359 [Humicola hyalothermophila]